MKDNPSADIQSLRLPNLPPAFYGTFNFVSVLKRILNFRSLPTHVCTSRKPGFSLGSFYITSLQRHLVRFSTEMWSGQDFSSKSEKSLGPDVSCVGWRPPIHSALQLVGAVECTSVHTVFQQLQFHGPLSLIQNPPGSVTSNEVNKNSSFIIEKILI
jgi:hypothetical protein